MMMIKKAPVTMKFFALILVAILLPLLDGCKKDKLNLTPDEIKGSAKEIYEQGKAKIKRDPEKARLLFKEVMHLFPDSLYAQRAKLGIADSYFREKDAGSMLMAASEYQEYVGLYPNSPDAVYAKYQVALCYFKQIRKPGRDQDNSYNAIDALQALIETYPDTNEAKDAQVKLDKVKQNIAQHIFLIGLSNLRMQSYKGALTRFKEIIDNYPNFTQNDRLFYCTGKAYYGQGEYDSAISFFQRVMSSFPKSKYLKKSQKLVEKISRLPKKKTEPTPETKPESESTSGSTTDETGASK